MVEEGPPNFKFWAGLRSTVEFLRNVPQQVGLFLLQCAQLGGIIRAVRGLMTKARFVVSRGFPPIFVLMRWLHVDGFVEDEGDEDTTR